MCAAFESKGRASRPGKPVRFHAKTGPAQAAWAGFARAETLAWWQKNGGELVDIPADRFAERSDLDRRLIWADVPHGQVIRGLLENPSTNPLLKIVTRASSPEELQCFQHPRMPLVEAPLYSPAPLEPEPVDDPQGMLF